MDAAGDAGPENEIAGSIELCKSRTVFTSLCLGIVV